MYMYMQPRSKIVLSACVHKPFVQGQAQNHHQPLIGQISECTNTGRISYRDIPSLCLRICFGTFYLHIHVCTCIYIYLYKYQHQDMRMLVSCCMYFYDWREGASQTGYVNKPLFYIFTCMYMYVRTACQYVCTHFFSCEMFEIFFPSPKMHCIHLGLSSLYVTLVSITVHHLKMHGSAVSPTPFLHSMCHMKPQVHRQHRNTITFQSCSFQTKIPSVNT